MYGTGIVKGLGVTIKHFVETYIDDIRWLGRRYYNPEVLKIRQSTKARGVFTVQYPEEKLPIPEEFRMIPFLLYEQEEEGVTLSNDPHQDRCTACGICAKVCPPQCIWIDRAEDPESGRPVTKPREFFIDIDICMNCGLCAEFCPFDAIKMDHEFELSSYDRFERNIYNKRKLSKPVDYYASIRPVNYAREEIESAEKEAKKKRRGRRR